MAPESHPGQSKTGVSKSGITLRSRPFGGELGADLSLLGPVTDCLILLSR